MPIASVYESGASDMAITIPDKKKLRTTTNHKPFPAQAKTQVDNPCPIGVSASGTTGSGAPLCEPTVSRVNYIGYNIRDSVPAGAADDEAYSVVSGCIVEGFAGAVPGTAVYVDPTARPAVGAEGAFSGLTHTIPAGGVGESIGVAVRADKIYFYTM
jgi:hypothetical protein